MWRTLGRRWCAVSPCSCSGAGRGCLRGCAARVCPCLSCGWVAGCLGPGAACLQPPETPYPHHHRHHRHLKPFTPPCPAACCCASWTQCCAARRGWAAGRWPARGGRRQAACSPSWRTLLGSRWGCGAGGVGWGGVGWVGLGLAQAGVRLSELRPGRRLLLVGVMGAGAARPFPPPPHTRHRHNSMPALDLPHRPPPCPPTHTHTLWPAVPPPLPAGPAL